MPSKWRNNWELKLGLAVMIIVEAFIIWNAF